MILTGLGTLTTKLFNGFGRDRFVFWNRRILKYSVIGSLMLFLPVSAFVLPYSFKPYVPYAVVWIVGHFIGLLALSVVINTNWKNIVIWEKIVFFIWLFGFLPITSFGIFFLWALGDGEMF